MNTNEKKGTRYRRCSQRLDNEGPAIGHRGGDTCENPHLIHCNSSQLTAHSNEKMRETELKQHISLRVYRRGVHKWVPTFQNQPKNVSY